MTPKSVADLVAHTPGERVEETAGSLVVVRAGLADPTLRASWLALRAAPPAFLSSVDITEADGDEPMSADIPPDAGQSFRVTLRKADVGDGVLRILRGTSLPDLGMDLDGADLVEVADMESDQSFSTFRSRLRPWTAASAAIVDVDEPLPNPRQVVKDFTGRAVVPEDLRPSLLRDRPERESAVFRAWREAATRRLLASLADQVADRDGALAFHFSGPPSVRVTTEALPPERAFEGLNAAGLWVYASGRDFDTRHLMFATEFARAFRSGEAPDRLGERSLESAQAAFRAHVQSGSKETLKALGELRKAVLEESQKASQRAQDLTSALWRDLAVAAAPFVLRILPDAARVSNASVAAGFAFGAAVFVLFSYGAQVFINHRYFKHQKDARTAWRESLAIALTADELDRLSERPVNETLKDYGRIRFSVGLVYAVLVLVLATFGWVNLSAARSAVAADRPTASAATTPPTPATTLPAASPASAGVR